jgi:lysophospholipase L1-like esterase
MQNCTTSCPCGWGSQFAGYFNSYVTVKNNAAGGRSIQTWMYEPNVSTTMGTNGECVTVETNSTRWATTLSSIKAGDYLFIQFGINDGSSTCNRHVGTARYQTLMTRMAKAALDKGAHPILLTAVSAISCSGSTAKATRGFLTETRAAATALGIPIIDLHQLSINLYNTLGLCPLPAGNSDVSATTGGAVGAFFCDDHTHFDKGGALQIAGLVANALKTQGIPLAAYLK